MLVLGVFFLVMALINFGIFRMHENKAEQLESERAELVAAEAIEKNDKKYKQRLSAIKSTKFTTGFLGIIGALCLLFWVIALLSY